MERYSQGFLLCRYLQSKRAVAIRKIPHIPIPIQLNGENTHSHETVHHHYHITNRKSNKGLFG